MSANNQILVKEHKGKWYVFDNVNAESWDGKNECEHYFRYKEPEDTRRTCFGCEEPEPVEPPKEPVIDIKRFEEIQLATGYVKTPSGWIAHGEATPAQMNYHLDWMKRREEPVKKPNFIAYFDGEIDVNESLRRIARYLDERK